MLSSLDLITQYKNKPKPKKGDPKKKVDDNEEGKEIIEFDEKQLKEIISIDSLIKQRQEVISGDRLNEDNPNL